MSPLGQRYPALLGPAIRRDGLIYSLPKPARHHHVIKKMAEAGVAVPIGHGADVQGFMTVHGFKDRGEAAEMVGRPGKLFSEDVW